ncbi:MAG: TMEM175 family protein [Candidatus ainarchaeum sp.]|nr:TMEM175 family protein [Candidatus ainarchaeum sp.]
MEGAEENAMERLGKRRLENITDAIFAFAMTLLVLNIEVPEQVSATGGENPVFPLLASLLPDFFHYFTAFLVLAAFWFVHHCYYERFVKLDRTALWLGIGALLMIALIPFTTNLADTYIGYGLSAVVFELNIAVIGLFFYLQWVYAESRGGLLKGNVGPKVSAQIVRSILVIPLASVIAIALSLMGFTWSALVLFVALPISVLFFYG